jgi:hypothetical protein
MSANMFGVRSGTNGVLQAADVVHILGFALAILAIFVFAIRLIAGILRTDHRSTLNSSARKNAMPWLLDDLLLFGCLGGIVVFLKLATASNYNYDRYLTSAIIFASILAGHFVGSVMTKISSIRLVGFAGAVALASIGLLSAGTESTVSQPVLAPASVQLAKFLEAKGLHDGIGDYWSASITSVMSDDAVVVRPVIGDHARRIVRYGRQSDAVWYVGKTFQFLVFTTATPFGVDSSVAAATYGAPAHTYVVGNFRVLTWDHLISVSLQSYDPG